jgi:hypothetical protein
MQINRDTVLLVCNDRDESLPILERLFDNGFGVVGPVSTGAVAMAVAAQTYPTVAIIADAPTGRRTANELAGDLMATWGIRSLVLDRAQEPGSKTASANRWGLRPGQAARLRTVLSDQDAPEDDPRWYGGRDDRFDPHAVDAADTTGDQPPAFAPMQPS